MNMTLIDLFMFNNSVHVTWPVNYAGQSMRNRVLCAVIEAQMNTQLLFSINVNKQMVKLGKYFADFNFCGTRLTAKYLQNWTTRKFPILR